jgi:hypothetical protein
LVQFEQKTAIDFFKISHFRSSLPDFPHFDVQRVRCHFKVVTGGDAARLLAHAKSRWRTIRWILAACTACTSQE